MYPKNEAETIELYKTLQDDLGWRIVHLQGPFPDAVIENAQGKRLVVEFEYRARNFKTHGHDPKGCDLIVCWRNNWIDAPLPVWALDGLTIPIALLVKTINSKVEKYDIATEFEIAELERALAEKTRNADALSATLRRMPKFYGPVVFNRVGTFYSLNGIDIIRLGYLEANILQHESVQALLDNEPTLWEKEQVK